MSFQTRLKLLFIELAVLAELEGKELESLSTLKTRVELLGLLSVK